MGDETQFRLTVPVDDTGCCAHSLRTEKDQPSCRTHAAAGTRAARGSAYVLTFYAYFAFGVLLQTFPPLLGTLMGEFGVTRQSAALVMTLFMAPLVLLAVPAGFLVDRYGTAAMSRTAFALMLLGGVIAAFSRSFAALLAGRMISGAGGAVLVPVLLKLIAGTFPRDRYGLALGVFAAGLPAGTGIAFNIFAPLGHGLGWRTSALAAVATVASAAAVSELLLPRREAAASDPAVNPARVLGSGELWRLAVTAVFGYTAIVGFTTWAPTALIRSAGIPVQVAAFIASLLLVIDIPFSPLWGRLSDRLRRRKSFIVTGFTTYLAGSLIIAPMVAIGHPAAWGLVAVVTFMGIGCAMFFPAALAIPAEVAAPELAGAAFGMFLAAQVTGMTLGPMVVGYALDHGSAPGAFLTVSAMTLAGLLAALTLRSR